MLTRASVANIDFRGHRVLRVPTLPNAVGDITGKRVVLDVRPLSQPPLGAIDRRNDRESKKFTFQAEVARGLTRFRVDARYSTLNKMVTCAARRQSVRSPHAKVHSKRSSSC
jgi:hypothetical protein